MKSLACILVSLLFVTQAHAEALICMVKPMENAPSLVVNLDNSTGRWVADVTYVDEYLVEKIGNFEVKETAKGPLRIWDAVGFTLKMDTGVRSRGYTRAQARVLSKYSGKVLTETELLCR